MNEAHTRYLFKNFSFFKPNQPATETSMCFGFECGDGWFELIKNLCEKLKSLNIPDLRVLQVKEKFGGLRFYAGAIENDKADEAFKLIDKAEDDSVNICEKCGKPGTLQTTRSWLKTLCEKCSA